MMRPSIKPLLQVLLFAGLAMLLLVQRQAQARLRGENQALREQIARLAIANERPSKHSPPLRLPAPSMLDAAASTPAPMESGLHTNLFARLTNDSDLKLPLEQVEPYLEENRRSAASLLAAYHVSGEIALLEEALQTYPADARVACEAACNPSLSPEQRRQWLDALEQADANNALPNYLSALDYFNAGKTDQAVQALIAASGKSQMVDFRSDRVQDMAELLSASGYTVAEAKALAAYNTPLVPSPRDLRTLGRDLVGLANAYRQDGDELSAQASLQLASNLGQHYAAGTVPGEPLIMQLAGINIQLDVLSAMDPASACGNSEQTVQEQINQLSRQKVALKAQGAQIDSLMQKMTDLDWINYCDRANQYGETPANQWLLHKHALP